MEQIDDNHLNLGCEIKEILENVENKESLVFSSEKVEIYQHSKRTSCVSGVVKLLSSPHFSLTLHTGSADQPLILRLNVVDCAKHLSQWISVVGKKVVIHQLLIVCEIFHCLTTSKKLQYVNIFVNWENLDTFENINTTNLGPLVGDGLSPEGAQSIEEAKGAVDRGNCRYRVMVHHVSMPFYVGKLSTSCLVFISYVNYKQMEKKLWLILSDTQVAWKDFLIPNREYIIELPLQTDKYFDEFHRPLDVAFSKNCSELKVIFHHQDIFSTLDGCQLPYESKIFLTGNTELSAFILKCKSDPLSLWYSADEADNASSNLVTLYGEVAHIKYEEEQVFKSCYLCIQAKPKEPIISEPQLSITHSWTNPWNTQSSLGKDELLQLPSAEDGNYPMKTGVPGKLVQIITLTDLISGNKHSVYIKHSYIWRTLQLFRLTCGMVLCISHLNRRRSKAGRYYYITTILSSFRVLSYTVDQSSSKDWGQYGLFGFTEESHVQRWGTLEAVDLVRVVITAKCNHCRSVFFRETCSKDCSSPNAYTTSAYALCNLVVDDLYSSEEMHKVSNKVLIKDNFVPKLLGIPENIWEILLETAAKEELVYSSKDFKIEDSYAATLDIRDLFPLYCYLPKRTQQFYISVKKMTSCSDEDNFYFCTNLEPFNKERLRFVAELVKATNSR